ncbi:MAG: class IV adenylate cyclase [Isosphaeraceae bacterium]
MSYEVEIKYRTSGLDDLASRLLQLGAVECPAVEQEDAYMAHPGRDFARTHEALRLRREGDENLITYKGPKLTGPTKTREEIELPLGDGPETMAGMHRLFQILGFRPVAVVRKTRRPFRLEAAGRPMIVALDWADGLGTFLEVETIAEGPDDLPGAQAAVLQVARSLDLDEGRIEPRSYLRMTLDRAQRDGPV